MCIRDRSWSKRQFNAIWESQKFKPVYVYDQELIRLTPQNKDRLFKKLQRKQFSLFPFYTITDPSKALVITQNQQLTPVLDDLKGSDFADKLNHFFKNNAIPVAVFDLGIPLFLASKKNNFIRLGGTII